MVEAAGVEQVFHSMKSITYALSMGYKFLKSPECRGVGTSLVQILFFVQNQAPSRGFSPVGTNLVHGLPQRYRFAIAISGQF
jgi:hypothetical protein